MKQAHSEPMSHRQVAYAEAPKSTMSSVSYGIRPVSSISSQRDKLSHLRAFIRLVTEILAILWFTLTLPLRLVFWAVAWFGRLSAVLLGFALMVLGVALWAGPLFFVGIPVFIVGLLLTLRCLE
jgi:hypothetical protein